ncbi:MAG: aminoglycoside phosphotransferase family protein, partial [Pseudomonadota bacterium]
GVVKIFPGSPLAQKAMGAEVSVLTALGDDPSLPVPRFVGIGEYAHENGDLWHLLVMTRIEGSDWLSADPAKPEKRALAGALGEVLKRVHAITPEGPLADWPVDHWAVDRGAAMSSVPGRLAAQAADFVAEIATLPPDPVFVHGDLMALHVFVDGDTLTGIIDWGDALVADRPYELAKLHLDLFEADKALLRRFLGAYGWPKDAAFAQRCLAQAFLRQAHCVAQHGRCDVFHKLPGLVAMDDLPDLNALADRLFRV